MIRPGEDICPDCGEGLKYYDRIRRIVRFGGSEVECLKIRRYICLGCGRVHNELPRMLIPFKQYSAEVIRGFIFGDLTSDDLRFEDYPCEAKLPVEAVVKKHRKAVVCYTKDEQEALLGILEMHERPAYALTELILETGLRIGEGIALKWDDILWRRKAISINKTMIRIANRRMMLVQNGAKSKTSNRVIPLSETAYRLLSEMYEQAEDKRGYIFVDRYGEPLSYESVRYQIHFACVKAGVPYLGMHAFRHTFATNCYDRGCDVKILSKLLGHSDVAITYNTYIHLYGDALEEMRKVIG